MINETIEAVRERKLHFSKTKKENGITLIALVITLIVLLILGGVTITTLTGGNGILNRTREANNKTESALEEEKVKLSVVSAQTANNGVLTTENLNKELQNNFNNNIKAEENTEQWVYRAKSVYVIHKDGSIEINPEIKISIKEIEKTNIIINVNVYSNENIEYLRIINSQTKDTILFQNVNSNIARIEYSTQMNIKNNIEICINGKIKVANCKINNKQIGRENQTLTELKEGFYAYGNNGKYYYKKVSGVQTFSNKELGDPCPGTPKLVYSIDDVEYEVYSIEKTNAIFDIANRESDGYKFTTNGEGISKIQDVIITCNGKTEYTGEIDYNEFFIEGILKPNEIYVLEITYEKNSKYIKTIQITKDEEIEERKLGSENVKISTGEKYYYIKYGVNDKWTYKWIKGDNIAISNATMGNDPAPGSVKEAYLIDIININEKVDY